MFCILIGLLAILSLCSVFAAVGLVLNGLLDHKWSLSWAEFGGGAFVTTLFVLALAACYGIGYAILHHVWRDF